MRFFLKVGSWFLCFFSSLDLGVRILEFGFWILVLVFFFEVGFRVLVCVFFGGWILDLGSCVFFRVWILDFVDFG